MASTARILRTSRYLHALPRTHWKREVRSYVENHLRRLPTRFERAARGRLAKRPQGDVLLERIFSLFHHGFGLRWSEMQTRIFNTFVEACLPLIYGDAWPDHKARVLRSRGLTREEQFVLVNMARRNGKTFVTSAAACCILLVVPGASVAVFSTGERTARMLMTVVVDMMESAFSKGSHVTREDFNLVQKNKESLLYEGPDGTKRLLGCFPGSVRVSSALFGGGGKKCEENDKTPKK